MLQVLPQHKTISEVHLLCRAFVPDDSVSQMLSMQAGLQDGDTVYVARAPVRCLTASHDGTAAGAFTEQSFS